MNSVDIVRRVLMGASQFRRLRESGTLAIDTTREASEALINKPCLLALSLSDPDGFEIEFVDGARGGLAELEQRTTQASFAKGNDR